MNLNLNNYEISLLLKTLLERADVCIKEDDADNYYTLTDICSKIVLSEAQNKRNLNPQSS